MYVQVHIEKVPFWLKLSKLLVSVMLFGGKNYVTNIVTGKAVQWDSCTCIRTQEGKVLTVEVGSFI